MSKYTITMSDGVVLDNLTMNGTMYVSKEEVALSMLNEEALSRVTIVEVNDEGRFETVMTNLVCDNVLCWPEGWLFNLRQMSDQEIYTKNLEKRLEENEIAMMELASMIGG